MICTDCGAPAAWYSEQEGQGVPAPLRYYCPAHLALLQAQVPDPFATVQAATKALLAAPCVPDNEEEEA